MGIESTNDPNGSESSAEGRSGKKQIPCQYCQGEVESEENGRATSSPTLFPRIQNVITAVSTFITALFGGTKTVSRKDAAYDGEECKICGGKGSYDDPSDTAQEDQAAASYIESQTERLTELEGQMGSPIGGSRCERIAGDELLIVGQEFNNAPTYTVKRGALKVPANMVVKQRGRAAVPQGGESNAIIGLNPPANSAGGNYTIIVGNHYKLYAGAQGINIKTNGNLDIDGGIVSFTGAEVTVGSKLGQTAIEGDHLLLQGKHVTINPMNDNKQMSIMGSVAATGNVQAGGAYFDNLYFVKGSCPADQKPTKVSSTTDLISGPAQWSVTGRNLELAIRNLKKWLIDCSTDPVLTDSAGILTPRGILKIDDNLKNLEYGLLPLETRVTGICFGLGVGFTAGVVINFPHTHGFPDAPHSHVITMPAIACDTNERAEAVRKAADAAGINGPVAAVGMIGSYFSNLFKAGATLIGAVFGAEGAINDNPYQT
jgi:hypothetical protein